LAEQFEYEGYWWLPKAPQDSIAGKLRFDPEQGGVLELRGVFKGVSPFEELQKTGHAVVGDETKRYDLILGVVKGKLITLKDCIGSWGGFSSPGFEQSKFFSGLVFEGVHFERVEDVRFKKIFIHYSYLNEWARLFGGSIKLPMNQKGNGEIVIKYKRPDSITMLDDEVKKITMVFSYSVKGLSWFTKEMGVEQKTYLAIEMQEEVAFEKYLNLIYHLQMFISLAVTKPVYPLIVEGITDYNLQNGKSGTYNPPINIFYTTGETPAEPEELSPLDPLFLLGHTQGRIESFLKNWIEKSELLGPVYNLYFAVRYKPEMYSDLQFLSLTRALEVYHARVTSNQSIQLKRRLIELLSPSELRDFLVELIGDKERFAEKVKDTRNFFTHYNRKLEKKAATDKEFILMLCQMKIIVEIYFLKEIGFDWKEILDLIKHSKNYEECMFMKHSRQLD
jgi:hypothetical protein